MKKAKSFKLIILSVAFCFSLLLGALFSNFSVSYGVANADYKSDTANYFETTCGVEYADDNLVVSAKNGEKFSIASSLVINDFGMKIFVPENATSLDIEFTSNSFVLHGNKNTENGFDTRITNKISIDIANNKAKLNDVEKDFVTAGYIELAVNVTDNEFNAVLTSTAGAETFEENGEYYKIAGVKKSTASVSLTFGVAGETAEKFAINYIDQNTADLSGAYRQTFTLVDNDVKPALPMVIVSEEIYNSNGEFVVKDGKEEGIAVKVYSIYGNVDEKDIYLKKSASDNAEIEDMFIGEKSKNFILNKNSSIVGGGEDKETFVLTDGTNDYGSIEIIVLDEGFTPSEAPKYVYNKLAIEAFKDALVKATMDGNTYIALGKSVEIPSLKDLVKYEYATYDQLKYTVYVNSPIDENKTATSMKIKVDVPGEYKFFVMFKDGDNSMDSPIDNKDIMEGKDDATKNFVFSFKIEDNAPLVVKANEETAGTNGYVGVRYNAVPFEIDAENYTPVYTLWYNADVNATEDTEEGWVKVYKKSEISSSYKEEVFTKEDVETINYNGKLEFTPVKAGTYRIDCEVSSGLTVSASADSYLIKVTEPKLKVKPENQWLKNNMLSVIFLGVGTLCLAGILVLLFIKPKEQTKKED